MKARVLAAGAALLAMPLALAQTVTLSLASPHDGTSVLPGATIDWSISFTVSTGDNAGLALVSTDLVQEPNNPATLDIPPADAVPVAMDNFSRPDGISNPGESNPTTGYIGVQRGTPGALDIRQIGGGQNTFGVAQAAGVGVAENANVVGGVGQSGAVTLASGSITAPLTEGSYSFALTGAVANTLDSVATPPDHSPVSAATVGYGARRIVITVSSSVACGSGCDVPGGDADTNGDCVVDLTDLADVLANFGAAGAGLPGDTDNNSMVDLTDLANVLALFGTACPA